MAKRTKEDAARDAWERAFKDGSKALQTRLRSIHANNPAFQQFLGDSGLDVVKVRNKTALAKAKAAERKAQSNKAWGATKGTKMGGEDGSSQELRDTTVPLSPEQHAKVKAAEKAAKPVKEKKAKAKKAPAKKKAPEAAPSRLDLLKKFASRKKINNPPVSAKQLRTIAAVGGQDHDHGGFDDLSDTQYGGRGSYNEEVEQVDENDYFRRRKKEEDIISGKKPERKKISMGSDYAARRRKERLANKERMDEEMNNRITKIHVRGQNVIVHRYDTEAKGEYKEVKHHSTATAAQTYARSLHRARGRGAKLVIEGIEQVDEGDVIDFTKARQNIAAKKTAAEPPHDSDKHYGTRMASDREYRLASGHIKRTHGEDRYLHGIGVSEREGLIHYEHGKKNGSDIRKGTMPLPTKLSPVKEESQNVNEMIPYALSAANYNAELARAKRDKLAQLRAKMKQQLDKDSEDTSNPFANFPKQDDMKKEEVEQIAERKWDFAARIKRKLIPGAARQQATRRAADLGDQAKTHANLGRGVGGTTSPKDTRLARIKAKAAGKYRKIAAVDEAVKKSAAPARRMGSVARYSTANKKWQFVRDPMVKTITGMSEGMLSNIVAKLTKKKPVDLKAAAKQRRADAIKYAGKLPKPKQSYQGLPSDMTRKPSHTRSERDANVVLGAKK